MNPQIIAHRGAWYGHAAENSAAAFTRAVALGVDGVEFDVRADAGAAPVVSHDPDLKREYGLDVRVRDHGVRVLKRLTGGALLALDEVFDIVAPLDLLDVEIKCEGLRGHEPFLRRVAKTIARRGLRRKVLITSFNPFALAQLKTLYPPVRTGYLIGFGTPWFARNAAWGRAAGAEATLTHWSQWSGKNGDAFHARGLAGYVWTVNDYGALKAALASAPLRGVITDRPVELRSWLAELNATSRL